VTTTGAGWQRVTRLDPDTTVRRLAELTGIALTVEGLCPGGEVGAAYVRWPDGHRSVLTYGDPRAADLVEVARAAGIPAPRYELVTTVDRATVLVQERLPGAPPARVDRALVEQMVALNDRMAGLLATSPAVPPVDLYLTGSGPGFCLHEPLARHDRRTRAVLDWVRDVGRDHPDMTGDDLTHMDFHPGNVLVDGGRVTGVIDWDGACRGDRHFDLVTLRFDLALRAPELTGRLDELLRTAVPARSLRAYRAHMSLRLVDWSIRHHAAAEVDVWLSVAATGMAAG
jgi:aminoglycoside phosphotransferase (APT) family kinase protein